MSPILILDFDSTLISKEGLEILGTYALEGRNDKEEVLAEMEQITSLGMEGKLPFDQSLRQRVGLLGIRREHIDQTIEELKKSVSTSILEHRNFFSSATIPVYVVSGGFLEFILPVTGMLGIPKKRVFANEFLWDEEGNATGVQPGLLAEVQGKVKQVRELNLQGYKVMVGDGYTDYEVKEAGEADQFIAYTENAQRKTTIEVADRVARDFDEVLETLLVDA